jgi:hypothetical protein
VPFSSLDIVVFFRTQAIAADCVNIFWGLAMQIFILYFWIDFGSDKIF